jgi:hypothetical protein
MSLLPNLDSLCHSTWYVLLLVHISALPMCCALHDTTSTAAMQGPGRIDLLHTFNQLAACKQPASKTGSIRLAKRCRCCTQQHTTPPSRQVEVMVTCQRHWDWKQQTKPCRALLCSITQPSIIKSEGANGLCNNNNHYD